ncbi:unnamed protein product [Citrullus colocynthis]|uniref:Pentatricopeptide repeat-containing protein n=1 Tax=Citrullus colocynthis TaxID=252529 RepID=A0ABP0YFD0_9ROSI
MWDGRMRSKLCAFSLLGRTCFSWSSVKSTQHVELGALTNATMASGFSLWPTRIHTADTATALKSNVGDLFSFGFFSRSYISPTSNHDILNATSKESCHYAASDDHVSGDDDDNHEKHEEEDMNINDKGVIQDVDAIMDIFRGFRNVNRTEVKNKLEHCCIKVSGELVVALLSRIRNDWEAAFTFFVWAGKQPGYAHSVREYHSMISILGKMRKFDTAWALIDEMRGGTTGSSLVSPQTLLIMIRKYCAVHDVGKAINTFHAHKRFGFNIGLEEFQNLLSALCRYKNVKDAEYLLFCNKDVFPFNTKSFNIILNGWCNIIGSLRDAERVWKEMTQRGISHDAVSYASFISCYSKTRNLYKVLRLFDDMKQMKVEPDRKVYNAVIHALAKGRLLKEAINLIKTMEDKGIIANVVTYNSVIKPLCKARKFDEARAVFDELLQRGLCPTIQTYHAFLRFLRTEEEIFELLEKMRKMGCDPTAETYIMLIRKFCRWRQLDNASRIWHEMSENGISPDRSSYMVLIHGLFLNGKLEDAYKYYLEMKEKELLPEPKIDEILQAWLAGKPMFQENPSDCSGEGNNSRLFPKKIDFHRQPEIRKVSRDCGFSFWKQ